MTTLVISGGRVLDPSEGVDAALDVIVRNGAIAELLPAGTAAGDTIIDAAGCLVVPGLVDLHAHLREPGFEQKGTIATETLAALRGGFTTICAMPNTDPPPDSASEVDALLERIERNAHVRVFPIGCITRERAGTSLAELGELAAAGCVAFSDDGNPVANAGLMRRALEIAGALGIPLSEHCDTPELSAGGVMNEGAISERLGLFGEPAAAEIIAIARNVALAEATGAHLHVAHVTTARGVEIIGEARRRGVAVTCEVTPSHLFLTEDAVFGRGPEPAYDTNARINPPLRTEADRIALLRALNDGTIDAIATDHAPHATEDKLCEFDQAAPGISCAETALATIMTLVSRGELELTAALRAMTAGPVQAFALHRRVPGIGTLRPGAPADITVINPVERWTVDTREFASRGKNTPLDGVELIGRVVAVVRQGVAAMELESLHG
ncbi:MAG: dihydroorotase [Dehalococcoidia bacterium]